MEVPLIISPILEENSRLEFTETHLGRLSLNLFWKVINYLPEQSDRISLKRTCRKLYQLSKIRVIAIYTFNKSFIDPAGMDDYGFAPTIQIIKEKKIIFTTIIPNKIGLTEETLVFENSNLFGYSNSKSDFGLYGVEMRLAYESEPINRVYRSKDGRIREKTKTNRLEATAEKITAILFEATQGTMYTFPATPSVTFETLHG